ncbi:MAG: adenylate/guanylate cyclase domain-containing protein [Alphaproteobacteria bacterium]|nr:adenylate/guanylate cyclase domain-containing protein [Alphaproteobacteria bacterium]
MTDATAGAQPKARSGANLVVKVFRALFGGGRWIAWGVAAALITLKVMNPPQVDILRMQVFDAYQNFSPREAGELQVMVADIDEESLRALGQWPWPRTVVGEVVERLMSAGAVVVGFDVVFAEPDRMSPPLLADQIPGLPEEERARLRSLPSNDQMFAEIIRNNRSVLGQTGGIEATSGGPRPARPALAWLNFDPRPYMLSFPSVVANLEVIERAAVGRGLFSVASEVDGLVRRIPAIARVGDDVYPALSIEMLRVATNATTLLVRADPEIGGIKDVVLQGPNYIIPTDSNGRLLPHYAKTPRERYISMLEILSPDFENPETVEAATLRLAQRVEGKLVLVGASAAGLRDIRATPLEGAIPGVEVHAQLLESILTESLLQQPPWTIGYEHLIVMAAIALMMLGMFLLGARWTLLFFFVVAGGLGGLSWYLFIEERTLLDVSFAIGASFLIYVVLTYLNYTQEAAKRKEIKGAFAQYLSPALVEQLAAEPDKLQLGGEDKSMTVFFSDVRGFTTVSELFDAKGLAHFMNLYLTPMTDIALEERAYIDKYIGDAIMAFWNAPVDVPKHADAACRTVLRMRARMKTLSEELAPMLKEAAERKAIEKGHPIPIPHLAIGMGVNTGMCMVGNMGSTQKFGYTVMGDTVNLASRLEGQSKPYHVDNIISENTVREVTDFAFLEVDLIQVKGKTEPVRIFTLVGDKAVKNSQSFQELNRFNDQLMVCYRGQDWQGARRAIDACLAYAPEYELEGLYEEYRHRIDEYEKEPPVPAGEVWNGVYVAKTK